ncbi:glycosyltransferase family 2 protein [Bacillus sp. T2.9-1]|nr:glycosyltransferase family 2 protein [Bacillus sp. T2.9-1]
MISLALIVKDEEKTIKKCIINAKKLVDEIIVVDTGSTDNTLKILNEDSKVRVFNFAWTNNFSEARNYAIEQCTGDYVLFLDADEYVTFGKRNELEQVMKRNQIGKIKITSKFKKDNEVYEASSFISRFFPKNIRYQGAIHEQLNSDLPRIEMKLTVAHSGYLEKDKSLRNIPILLGEVKKNPNDAYYQYQLGKELRLNKEFKQSYTHLSTSYKLVDMKDSYYNQLILELLQTGKEIVAEETIRIINENEQRMKNISDFHFYKGLFYLDYCLKHMQSSIYFLSKIEESFLKCIEISNKKHIEYLKGTASFLALYNLGVYYEVIGSMTRAEIYYVKSAKYGYQPAKKRLSL